MTWLYYLAEANLYLGIFYLAYCLLLNRNTHYQLSRAYLIFSCVAAFVLPVLQVSSLKQVQQAEAVSNVNNLVAIAPIEPTYNVRQVVKAIPPAAKSVEKNATISVPFAVEHANVPANGTLAVISHFTVQDWLLCAYLAGAVVFLLLLFVKLYSLFKLTHGKAAANEGKYRVIYLNESDVAFSFFNYLFIGTNAYGENTIIRHELVHIRQKHSADIILLELLKIISWFNPCVYLVQNSLKTVHEYIADEQTAAHESDALTYASFLLKNAYGAGGPSITHSFFNYNLLKKRIMMLNQQRSGNLARLKYLVAIPLCAALLCASTLVFSKTYGWVDLAPKGIRSADKINAKFAARPPHLSITQHDDTATTSQLAIDPQTNTVVYTPAALTKTDSAGLMKNSDNKVKAVADSQQYIDREGRQIMPIVNVDGYFSMDHFLHNNIHYNSAKGEKGGMVEVEFTLDNERHITNLKIARSGGAKLDALALSGFGAYKGVVNDDAGRTLKIGVYFLTDDYTIFNKRDSIANDPGFGGELVIPNYKFPFTRTIKGFEYDESGIGFPGDNTNMANAKVIIYDKNGEPNWYFKSKCTPADLKMLEDKYGYTFPSAATQIIEFMHVNNVRRYGLAYAFNVKSYLQAPYVEDLYNYMLGSVAYPEEAKKAMEGGVVVLNFNLDNAGMMSGISVAQSAGKGMDEAAMSALQAYKAPVKDVAGKHSIAVTFCLVETLYHPVVSEKIKATAGYVGELAVCDAKSPIVNKRSAVNVQLNAPPPKH